MSSSVRISLCDLLQYGRLNVSSGSKLRTDLLLEPEELTKFPGIGSAAGMERVICLFRLRTPHLSIRAGPDRGQRNGFDNDQ